MGWLDVAHREYFKYVFLHYVKVMPGKVIGLESVSLADTTGP